MENEFKEALVPILLIDNLPEYQDYPIILICPYCRLVGVTLFEFLVEFWILVETL